ncbi:hypothetical protein V8G54_017367 [Vigna mungo]|uniref:Uncharacterized protein n=1 Tax=Vigna mungo TaxID=3915 RepID=A0AAQ3NPC8_VIGMU
MLQTPEGDPKTLTATHETPSASKELEEILHVKLRKCGKLPSPSMTCLRLDLENSNISVWQKRAGHCSDSNWVMMFPFGKKGDEGGNSSMGGGSFDSLSQCDQTVQVRRQEHAMTLAQTLLCI